jgi:ABC-type multidrug transport system fused ATPase/permease subunit
MVKVNTLLQLPRIFLEIIALTALSTLIFIMLYQQKSISNILTILGLFAAASFRLLPSVNRVMAFMQQIRFANSSIKLIFNEFVSFANINTTKSSLEQLIFKTFEADEIAFSYPNTSEITLKSVNLKFDAGEIIGIIGKSGSGKSTFIDLLLGLYDPLNGTLKVNNKPVLINDWQNIIGYVPQNIFLTDDTIRNNIAFGIPSELINEQRVNDVLEISQLSEFINDLPNGLETIVGERGISISGGQRQRIGIARALYNDPQILVFDEATSSLDSDTERAFMDSMKILFGRKTIVMVAHRMSTLVDCDKIYKFAHGKAILLNNFKNEINK